MITGSKAMPAAGRPGYDFPAVRDGRIVRETLPIRSPKGMSGFVFNTRRPLFEDVRVREALGYLFDFGWVNRNLYFGLVTRSDSYFAGSDLSSAGRPPTPREQQIAGALCRFPQPGDPGRHNGRRPPPTVPGGIGTPPVRRSPFWQRRAGSSTAEFSATARPGSPSCSKCWSIPASRSDLRSISPSR